MSRENIQSQLLSRHLEVHELVYSQPSVSVYRGQYYDFPAAVKVKYAAYGDSWAKYEEEIAVMMGFDHACLVKLYDSFWLETESQCYLVIVSEWCNKDLLKDTQQRKAAQFYWQEDQLWTVLRTLVSALAYMQSLSFAHRDIKPSNIFYAAGMGVKLGDFGSAAQRRDGSFTVTVTGTPQFLSPILRKAMMDRQFRIVHNVYKSDVFSLGLTFLTLMMLDFPHLFQNPNVGRAEIEELVVSLRFSEELRRLVMWMLEPEERDRCDFVMLGRYLGVVETAATETTKTIKSPTLQEPMQPSLSSSLLSSDSASLNTLANPSARSLALSKSYPCCLRCGRPIQPYSAEGETPVRLPCDPGNHQFCSGTCFLVFAYNNSKEGLKCPVCCQELPKEWVDLYVSEIKTDRTLSVRSSRSGPKGPERTDRKKSSASTGPRIETRSCNHCSLL